MCVRQRVFSTKERRGTQRFRVSVGDPQHSPLSDSLPRPGHTLSVWPGRRIHGRDLYGNRLDGPLSNGLDLDQRLRRVAEHLHVTRDWYIKTNRFDSNARSPNDLKRTGLVCQGHQRLVCYCKTTSASTAPCTSRRTCCPTHFAKYCAL